MQPLKWAYPLIITPQLLWTQSFAQTFEEKMHNIYKTSYSHEVAEDVWSQYVKNLGTRSYQVAKGDNLWTLSEVFFGDGHYWSKIWSYNERLTNPHLIVVGQKIMFFTGSIEEPPHLSLVDEKKDQKSPSPPPFAGTDKKTETHQAVKEDGEQDSSPKNQMAEVSPGSPVSIPPPRDEVIPVRPIPPVFKIYSKPSLNNEDKNIKFDMRPHAVHTPSIFAEAFLYEKGAGSYPQKNGRILESEEFNTLLGLNDFIYIESEEDLKIGEEFTVMDEKYNLKGLVLSFGSVISYLGRVRITNDLGENRYRAEVFQSHGEIKRGAWISREKIPSFSNDYQGQTSNLELKVIGGGSEEEINIFSQNDTIFLGGGSKQGLKNGDILGVYSRRDKRYRNTRIKTSPVPIAHIKIFNTNKTVASALVLESSEAILVGDKTGNPMILAQSHLETESGIREDPGIENQ